VRIIGGILIVILFGIGCSSTPPVAAVTPAVTNWTAQATPSNAVSYRLYWLDPSGVHHLDNPAPLWKVPTNFMTCWAVGLDAHGNESKNISNIVTNQ